MAALVQKLMINQWMEMRYHILRQTQTLLSSVA